MIPLRIKTLLALLLCWIAIELPCHGADYDYIDITNPFLKKSPVAIAPFKHAEEDQSAVRISADARNLLSETLVFTGYFKLINENDFPADSNQIDIVVPAVDFGKWVQVGTELLITGGLIVNADILEMELRLYDTVEEKLIIGKRYKGRIADYRQMIYRFCSDITQHFAGSPGYFNSRIAFVSTSTGHKEIYLAEFDGADPVQLTHDQSINLSPAWSGDGKWLAYTSFSKGNPDLYIRHLTENRGAVFAREGVNMSPAWVPGSFSLAATLSYTGDQEIYLLTGNGKIIKRLTYTRGIDVSPSFSPDGKKMAFVSKRAGTPQIHIMDMVSEDVKRLTFHGRYNTEPAWSPKGDKIAYTGLNEGKSDIYVIGVDGKMVMRLTQNEGDNESPSWSPDGSLIVFASNREGPSRIYIMTAFGTDQRRLLVMPGEQFTPRWSPNLAANPTKNFGDL